MENGILVLMAFVSGWLVAQVLKMVIAIVKSRGQMSVGEMIEWLIKSGGMPSGHAASFTAATVTIGMVVGFNSVIFALALCTTIIILYDAMNVRYAVGEQGKILNEMVEHHGHARHGEKKLKIVEGHTLAQVIVGVLLGVILALLATKIAQIW